ncbi:MAG: hypothetical protein WA982_17210 [Rubrobacteraceae bacterium]
MPLALPEVTFLQDTRGERPSNAVGAGEFWYEPEVWTLPGLSPAARVLYTGLCSFLGPGEINHHDLRNTLKANTDGEISAAFDELVHQKLLEPTSRGFTVCSVDEFEASGGSATS